MESVSVVAGPDHVLGMEGDAGIRPFRPFRHLYDGGSAVCGAVAGVEGNFRRVMALDQFGAGVSIPHAVRGPDDVVNDVGIYVLETLQALTPLPVIGDEVRRVRSGSDGDSVVCVGTSSEKRRNMFEPWIVGCRFGWCHFGAGHSVLSSRRSWLLEKGRGLRSDETEHGGHVVAELFEKSENVYEHPVLFELPIVGAPDVHVPHLDLSPGRRNPEPVSLVGRPLDSRCCGPFACAEPDLIVGELVREGVEEGSLMVVLEVPQSMFGSDAGRTVPLHVFRPELLLAFDDVVVEGLDHPFNQFQSFAHHSAFDLAHAQNPSLGAWSTMIATIITSAMETEAAAATWTSN